MSDAESRSSSFNQPSLFAERPSEPTEISG